MDVEENAEAAASSNKRLKSERCGDDDVEPEVSPAALIADMIVTNSVEETADSIVNNITKMETDKEECNTPHSITTAFTIYSSQNTDSGICTKTDATSTGTDEIMNTSPELSDLTTANEESDDKNASPFETDNGNEDISDGAVQDSALNDSALAPGNDVDKNVISVPADEATTANQPNDTQQEQEQPNEEGAIGGDTENNHINLPNIEIITGIGSDRVITNRPFRSVRIYRRHDDNSTSSSTSDEEFIDVDDQFDMNSSHTSTTVSSVGLSSVSVASNVDAQEDSPNIGFDTYSNPGDDDGDTSPGNEPEALQADLEELHEVLNKPKPMYTWNSTYELMMREHGLSGKGIRSLRNGSSPGFNARYYASRHVVERMKLSHCLRKHNGCVNSLNFHRNGDLLCSGSDDCRIIVWNWALNKHVNVFKSGHSENIFQTKFNDSVGYLDIISASRDGQVRRSVIPPSGGKVETERLYRHHGAVHKLVIEPQHYYNIISVGEDGYVRHFDLRDSVDASTMVKVTTTKKTRKVRLYSISHHPFAPEICVSGCDNFVRVYDKRNCEKPLHEMCPEPLLEIPLPQVTCAVYSNNGSEILASYSDDHIYLFDSKLYKRGSYLHRYRGHYNHRTIKGVNFFGPNSEYVISGSDCGNIFFWDKETEAILNFLPGDTMGVVNCLEPHPWIPVLATSGLDSNVKIWTPHNQSYPPDMSKLERCVKHNLKRSVIDEAHDFDDRQFHYFIRHFLRRHESVEELSSSGSDSDWPPVIGSSSSSTTSTGHDADDAPPLDSIQCRTQ